ncbi:hypothetical protein DMB92_00895 [Campylobacter sp. MIT 99-7217]|uniref:hypothetical protein n=1 Tax=Campylobacter sp. MIT 99-7217 TaxID=535091 RepID=UPI00115B8471|nr:hypothetical protein [Campylobacter sp. MIT 99-7217]TQR34554.1 hypothetical protein DMB92_00895 [Campylobacter sp. MIT 99-7217]
MKKILNLLAVSILGILVSACATFINGSDQTTNFTSNPSGASIVIKNANGVNVGNYTTPTRVKLERGNGYFKAQKYTIEVTKQGYKTVSFELNSRLSGWYLAGNLVYGGFIGWLVFDPITGAMYVLKPEGEGVSGNDKEVVITLIEDLTDEQRSKLTKIK